MLKIDSHQHFWNYDVVRDSWINTEMQVLRNDFLPQHLEPVLNQYQFDGCVVVQSDQSSQENTFQLNHAANHDFIKGVVGWVDLQAPDIIDQLEALHVYKKLKGFRHILQGEADRALMLKPAFQNGIAALSRFGFTYDLLILPDQLSFAETLVAGFPAQPFVLDHIAKPGIKSGNINEWAKQVRSLAQHEQVYCKVSGLVTEADWKKWTPADFKPYLDVVFEAFGPKRLMYGSDWPVCLLAADYEQVLQLMEQYTGGLSQTEQALFWGENAVNFYNLK